MRDLILTILTSSVISSLIVVLCNVFLNQKKNTLEYITNERSLWRKEVREIAEEIGKADKDKLNVSLTKLKVRINIYDKFIPNKIDTGDSRLWKLIEICEKNSDPELFKILKEKLIMMLSLMLKYDWEKSKKEVTVNRNNLLCVICIIVQVILFWLISYLSIIKFSLCLFWMIFYIISCIRVFYKIFRLQRCDRK